ncbi:proline dehydrogenase 1, mitochondrial-like [Centruroides sculpturatus]|uniref:proline dehydrogenase 1, mitochondrial-like n=1 Tax=Centruroides sculpturatus TaxID=218467 RepID=UPI000C6DA175|nr:proline dehydrogenase 1, mitochondrial-like [Centruroides sculpturatus]
MAMLCGVSATSRYAKFALKCGYRYNYTILRCKSSSATVVTSETTVVSSQTERIRQPDPLDLTFEDTKSAYKSKTTWELFRAFLVLKLTKYDYLVENHQKLLKLGRKILGPKLFRLLMKHTFYGHFVAGEDSQKIRPIIERLHSFGVKSILDYSAEEDISEEEAKEAEMKGCISAADDDQEGKLKQYRPYKEFADRRKYHVTARTYFYLSEAQCEKNMETFLKCIDAVAGTTKGTGFAAIKMTALGRPQLLLQLSEVIVKTRKFFKEVTGTEKHMALANVTPSVIEHKLEDFNINTNRDEVKEWLEHMDYDRKGLMNLFSWSGLVDMNYLISELFIVPNIKSGRMESIISPLTEEEEEMFKNMMRRLHHIAKVITKIINFNYLYIYLQEAYNNLVLDMELAKRQNVYFGAKLVRGAYMEQERLRAKQIGYEDPINPSYEVTSDMYHKALTEAMRQIINGGDRKVAVMVASHNEDTVRFTVNKMKELGIKPEHKVICFGQLYGMCDQVSFLLGQGGYSVYKYVPYGPVDEVLPYLSRRALENNGLLKKVDRECILLGRELKRRILTGQFLYTPKGDYTVV